MSNLVPTCCPRCGASGSTPYIMIGAQATCPSCGFEGAPMVPLGTPYPDTGYAMTFADFQQLCTEPRTFSEIRRLSGSGDRLISTALDTCALLELHIRLQGNTELQRAAYRVGMAEWR